MEAYSSDFEAWEFLPPSSETVNASACSDDFLSLNMGAGNISSRTPELCSDDEDGLEAVCHLKDWDYSRPCRCKCSDRCSL